MKSFALFIALAGLCSGSLAQDAGLAHPQNAYFYFDAESVAHGEWLPKQFYPYEGKDSKRGKVAADPEAPQGKKILRWDIKEPNTTDLYNEIQFDRLPPPQGTYYYAFFVRFDRKDGKDIWHHGKGADSADKGFEVVGDGIRWLISFGAWGTDPPDHHFSIHVGNPTYHLNRELEDYDAYYPNQQGFSKTKPILLTYEQWYAVVFKLKWAKDKTGEVALWVNGTKVLEYNGIQTVKSPGTFERLQIFGTIAQPAYDAPPHVRKVDAMLFTDDWQHVLAGGYLVQPRQYPTTSPPPAAPPKKPVN